MSGTIHVYGHQKFLDVEHVDGKIFTFLHGARKLDQLVTCTISYHEHVMQLQLNCENMRLFTHTCVVNHQCT